MARRINDAKTGHRSTIFCSGFFSIGSGETRVFFFVTFDMELVTEPAKLATTTLDCSNLGRRVSRRRRCVLSLIFGGEDAQEDGSGALPLPSCSATGASTFRASGNVSRLSRGGDRGCPDSACLHPNRFHVYRFQSHFR